MSAPVFCKFGHNSSLHASRETISIIGTSPMDGSPARADATIAGQFSAPWDHIIGAVNLDENVAHVMTLSSVYEVVADRETGVRIRRLGDRL